MKPVLAGYSGKPLPIKLWPEARNEFITLNPPPNLEDLPADAGDLPRLTRVAPFDCALGFATAPRAGGSPVREARADTGRHRDDEDRVAKEGLPPRDGVFGRRRPAA